MHSHLRAATADRAGVLRRVVLLQSFKQNVMQRGFEQKVMQHDVCSALHKEAQPIASES